MLNKSIKWYISGNACPIHSRAFTLCVATQVVQPEKYEKRLSRACTLSCLLFFERRITPYVTLMLTHSHLSKGACDDSEGGLKFVELEEAVD